MELFKVITRPVIEFSELAKVYEETYGEELERSDIAGDEFANNSYIDFDLEDILWDKERLENDFPEENYGEKPLFRTADLLVMAGFKRDDIVLIDISW